MTIITSRIDFQSVVEGINCSEGSSCSAVVLNDPLASSMVGRTGKGADLIPGVTGV